MDKENTIRELENFVAEIIEQGANKEYIRGIKDAMFIAIQLIKYLN